MQGLIEQGLGGRAQAKAQEVILLTAQAFGTTLVLDCLLRVASSGKAKKTAEGALDSVIDLISALGVRKKGREVARDSQHTKGNAVDIRLPDISPRALSRWIRGKRLGGVGIYRTSGFVHVDSGPIRSWSGR